MTVRPGDCVRLTKSAGAHNTGEAAIVLQLRPWFRDISKTEALVVFLNTGEEEAGWDASWAGWELVDA